jgi:hypothetical protein
VQTEEVQPEEELKLFEISNKKITEYMDFLNDYALTSLKERMNSTYLNIMH